MTEDAVSGQPANLDQAVRTLQIITAAMVMGVVLFAAIHLFGWAFALAGWRYIALLALIVVAAVAYFALGHLLGAFKMSEFKRALRRS